MTKYARLFSLAVTTLILLSACSTKPVEPEAPVETGQPGAPKQQDKLDPRASSQFRLALNAMAINDHDEALTLLQGLTRDFPQLSGPYVNIGLIHFQREQYDQAEAAFKQAIAIRDNNPVAYNHLGIIYRQQGKFAEAERAYLNALKHDPDYANAHLNLGILYDIYLQKFSEALQHYERYQALQEKGDELVNKWIVELQRRQKQSN